VAPLGLRYKFISLLHTYRHISTVHEYVCNNSGHRTNVKGL